MKRNAPRSTRTLIALTIAAAFSATVAFAQPGPAASSDRDSRRAEMQAKREQVRADMLKRLDTNADGSISQTEIDAAAAAHAASIDANGDGQISAAELEAFRDAQRAERQAQRQQKQLERMDSNADGQVSAEEFAAAHAKRMQRMDRNGDGLIEADELGHGPRGGHGGRHHGPRGG
jgi:Ca2+-binding EF-hand superfamily protein